MSDIDEILTFRGDGGEEAEDFIRAVTVQAFKKGKSKDQEWLSTFASTAFAGKALRWYRSLPRATRDDWDALQEAILAKDWDELKSHSTSTVTIPAAPPAAAPPAPTSAYGGISTAANHSLTLSPATSNPVKSGRIRAIKDGAGPPGYLVLSRNKGQLRFSSSTSPVDAVVVEWNSATFPYTLKLVGEDSSYCLLGAQFYTDNINFAKLGPGSVKYLYLTPVTKMQDGTRKAMSETNVMKNPAKGPAIAPLWSILLDGTLVATLKHDKVKIQLDLVIAESGNVWLATDAEATIQEWPELKGKPARLYLDML